MSIAYAPIGICYALNSTPPLCASCKVLHSGMQVLENYVHCLCCLLHNTNASYSQCCRLHTTGQKYISYETTKIAIGVIHLYSLQIKLDS